MTKKEARAGESYWGFFDLRAEFKSLFPGLEALGTLADVLGALGLERDETVAGPIRDARELLTAAAGLAQDAANKGPPLHPPVSTFTIMRQPCEGFKLRIAAGGTRKAMKSRV